MGLGKTAEKTAGEDKAAIMERRYVLPYNWCLPTTSRGWRQKEGIFRIISELLQEEGNLGARSLLDVGCGDGWYTVRFAEMVKEATGLDPSEQAIGFAKQLVKKAAFKVGSATDIPFSDEAFDVVVSIQTLEHISPKALPRACEEIVRVVKRGGTIIISVPSVLRPLSTAHYQHFTVESFAAYMPQNAKLVRAVGQEHHTLTLHVVERMLQNRVWLLTPLADRFNRTWFQAVWNKTSSDKGQNIIFQFKKSSA